MTNTASDQPIFRTAVEGELTIFTALAVKEQLLSAFAGEGGEVEVDLSQVTEVDSAGVQLLVAAKKESLRRGRQLRFCGHSPAVLDVLDLCDLSGFFGDPVLIPRAEGGCAP